MFLVAKPIHGKPRNYLCESYREKGSAHPKRRTLAYLGHHRTVQQRYQFLKAGLKVLRQRRGMAIRRYRRWEDMTWSLHRQAMLKKLDAQVKTLDRRIIRAEIAIKALEPFL